MAPATLNKLQLPRSWSIDLQSVYIYCFCDSYIYQENDEFS